ncbi:MAG: matrixin family metalloprotease [Gemmatimonadales bacterium]
MRLRPLATLTALLCAAALGDMIHRAWLAHRSPPAEPSASARSMLAAHAAPAARAAPLAATPADTLTSLERLDARNQLAAATGTVYFDSLLAEADSTLRRWPDSTLGGLRVAIMGGWPPGWRSDMIGQVRAALEAWHSAVPAIHFLEIPDSTGANIVVHWVENLGSHRTGEANITWDRAGRIHHVDVSLALVDPGGQPLSARALSAVAVHELGHALGLSHSPDSNDVLYSRTRTGELSPRDLATIRLLYQLRPGKIRQ